jgi:hypothetical protein
MQVGYRERTKVDYNVARFIGYLAIKPHLDKAHQNKAIDEIIPFSWEKEMKKQSYKPITMEEFEKMKEVFNFN